MKKFIKLSATGLGLGHLPKAPGTWGSLLGIPLAYAVSCYSWPLIILTLAAFTAFSIWISSQAEILFKEKDSSKIVIDEVIGMAIALFLIPFTFTNILYAFVLFRIFDITKPYPIKKIEKKCPSGFGIVLDDVAAGLYACGLLHIILKYL